MQQLLLLSTFVLVLSEPLRVLVRLELLELIGLLELLELSELTELLVVLELLKVRVHPQKALGGHIDL